MYKSHKLRDADDDDNFFDLEEKTKPNTHMNPTAVNSNGNSVNNS